MYDYRFNFYKPGKDYFTADELIDTLNKLHGLGFNIRFRPNNSHVDKKKGSIRFNARERGLNIEVNREGRFMDLIIGPAEGKYGEIGLLAIAQEQFDDQFKNEPEKNAQILSEAALAVFLGLKPFFAWGDHELEIDKLEDFLSFSRIGALAWNNFFSKELVEKLGGINKILLHPNSEEERVRANGMLGEMQFYAFNLSGSPMEPVSSSIAMDCEIRYPGAVIKSFEVPGKVVEINK